MNRTNKDVVLFVNSIHAPTYSALRTHAAKTSKRYKPVVIVDSNIRKSIHELNDQGHLLGNVEIITADFDSPNSIRQALRPYENRIAAVTAHHENSIHEFKKLIPYLPYLATPTESSLEWATDKKLMRGAFNAYDPTLSPVSMHVKDATPATIDAIERNMSYPVIIKPTGLERSLLISRASNREELQRTLSATFEQLHTVYRSYMKRLEPSILVEEFMVGDMFSVDMYVASDGTFRHTPLVKIITGNKVGFEDFFEYLMLTPTGLDEKETEHAYDTAERACKALGLRAVTAHCELMRTTRGWKVIEIGPRIGGYRHEMYGLSYGMNHIMNDLLNRAGVEPEVPDTAPRHTAVFRTYAHEEGRLVAIHGTEKIEQLPSFVSMKLRYKKGDMLKFAHNTGDAAIEVTLCNDDESQLEADIHTIEQVLHIETSAAKRPAKLHLATSR